MITRAAILLVIGTGVAASAHQSFRSTVDAVAIDVAVLSGSRPVAGLTAANFEVIDNGVRQTILEVVPEALPIDLTLVLDASGSISVPLHASILRGVKRVQDRLRPSDRVSIITFNERLREVLPLTPAVPMREIAFGQTRGETSLNDAIGLALVAPASPAERRQLAIVFTDGIDSTSFLDEPVVLDMALHSRTAVFVVAQEFPDALPLPFLRQLTESTGGLMQIVPPVQITTTRTTALPPKTPGDPLATGVDVTVSQMRIQTPEDLLDASFVSALDAFRASYVLQYTLAGVPRSGWHSLTVHVTKPGANYTVRNRRGYFGPPQGEP